MNHHLNLDLQKVSSGVQKIAGTENQETHPCQTKGKRKANERQTKGKNQFRCPTSKNRRLRFDLRKPNESNTCEQEVRTLAHDFHCMHAYFSLSRDGNKGKRKANERQTFER